MLRNCGIPWVSPCIFVLVIGVLCSVNVPLSVLLNDNNVSFRIDSLHRYKKKKKKKKIV